MDLQLWLLCLAAAIGLSLASGPNSLLVLTHGPLQGWRLTDWTMTGRSLGLLALIALSMTDIEAMLQVSAQALTGLKLAGGADLLWLGVALWLAPPMQRLAEAL